LFACYVGRCKKGIHTHTYKHRNINTKETKKRKRKKHGSIAGYLNV